MRQFAWPLDKGVLDLVGTGTESALFCNHVSASKFICPNALLKHISKHNRTFQLKREYSILLCFLNIRKHKIKKLKTKRSTTPQNARKRPRAPQSAPERPRAPQSGPKRPPRAFQSTPERPRAPQSAPERPRAP